MKGAGGIDVFVSYHSVIDTHTSVFWNIGMAFYTLPPVAKVYEALGAIADGRISFVSEQSAQIKSSSGDKVYQLGWDKELSWISSDDNASKWQGYMGYPVIAILLLKKPIPYDKTVAEALKGIPWKKLNTLYKNDYAKTLEDVLKSAAEKGFPPEAIRAECERILEFLKTMNIERRGYAKISTAE